MAQAAIESIVALRSLIPFHSCPSEEPVRLEMTVAPTTLIQISIGRLSCY